MFGKKSVGNQCCFQKEKLIDVISKENVKESLDLNATTNGKAKTDNSESEPSDSSSLPATFCPEHDTSDESAYHSMLTEESSSSISPMNDCKVLNTSLKALTLDAPSDSSATKERVVLTSILEGLKPIFPMTNARDIPLSGSLSSLEMSGSPNTRDRLNLTDPLNVTADALKTTLRHYQLNSAGAKAVLLKRVKQFRAGKLNKQPPTTKHIDELYDNEDFSPSPRFSNLLPRKPQLMLMMHVKYDFLHLKERCRVPRIKQLIVVAADMDAPSQNGRRSAHFERNECFFYKRNYLSRELESEQQVWDCMEDYDLVSRLIAWTCRKSGYLIVKNSQVMTNFKQYCHNLPVFLELPDWAQHFISLKDAFERFYDVPVDCPEDMLSSLHLLNSTPVEKVGSCTYRVVHRKLLPVILQMHEDGVDWENHLQETSQLNLELPKVQNSMTTRSRSRSKAGLN